MTYETDIETIRQYYNSNTEEEWSRLDGRKPEFEITMRHLKKHLPSHSRILDVGGGPGRYSLALTKLGHHVTLMDFSENSVEFARSKAEEFHIPLDGFLVGNALHSHDYPKEMFDAVLCMGPLYHLNSKGERRAVINNCLRVLKPGGIFAASFVSIYAKYTATLKYLSSCAENLEMEEAMHKRLSSVKPHLKSYLQIKSIFTPRTDDGFTISNYINPARIDEFMQEFGLKKLAVTAAECLLSHHNELLQLPDPIWNELMDITFKFAQSPQLWGSCEHMLYIGKKSDIS